MDSFDDHQKKHKGVTQMLNLNSTQLKLEEKNRKCFVVSNRGCHYNQSNTQEGLILTKNDKKAFLRFFSNCDFFMFRSRRTILNPPLESRDSLLAEKNILGAIKCIQGSQNHHFLKFCKIFNLKSFFGTFSDVFSVCSDFKLWYRPSEYSDETNFFVFKKSGF